MRSNVAQWAELHRGGYFANHPRYKNRNGKESADLEHVAQFGREFRPGMRVVVIGAGYGRETAVFAPLVGTVYAIDVCQEVLADMARYLGGMGISNVVPVLAEGWREKVPAGMDLFYSMATFQHLTKDLAKDYLAGIAEKLKPIAGRAIVQFAENETGTADADLVAYEPNVRWTTGEILEACRKAGLEAIQINTVRGTNRAGREWAWHWAFMRIKNAPSAKS